MPSDATSRLHDLEVDLEPRDDEEQHDGDGRVPGEHRRGRAVREEERVRGGREAPEPRVA